MTYVKKFDEWSTLKKKLQGKVINFYCNQREIWWCALGSNIGSEEDGKGDLFERPVLIIKIFSTDMVRIAPLTSKIKYDTNYVPIYFDQKKSSIMISHIRSISTKRLSKKISRLDMDQFKIVQQKIIDQCR